MAAYCAMSDGGGNDSTGAPSEAGQVEVTAIGVDPSVGPVDAPLGIRLSFSLKEPLADVSWRVAYTVDVAGRQRHVIELGGSGDEKKNYAAGAHEWAYTVERMDVAASGIKPKHLLRNVGLLSVSMAAGGEDVLSVRLVTQVAKGADGTLVRTVFNPLE